MARLLDKIVGHHSQQEHLLAAVRNQQLPSTLLFVGPAGVGKKTLGFALAQALVCETETAPCGQCGPCLRVEKNQSEGVLFIKPEKNQIKIEQAHSILDFLSLRSLSKSRVVIIDQAEQANPQTANALLKALEEPPPNVYFILVALSSQHVLPTIRSRSMIVHFSPLSVADMSAKVSAPSWALRASHGSFERLNFLQDQEELEVRGSAVEFLKEWLNNREAYLGTKWKDRVRERSLALSLARHLVLFFRDALFLQSGDHEHLLNVDQMELVKAMAQASQEHLFVASQKVIQLEKSLLSNRDSLLTYEEFWLTTSQGLS